MNNIALQTLRLAANDEEGLERVRQIQGELMSLPQVQIPTHHVLHGGMYARTITIPAGTALSGAFVQVPTVLIISGSITVLANDRTFEIDGYAVIPGSAGRKQAFVAHTDTSMTMIFATSASSIAEAEAEFTTEPELLVSRLDGAINQYIVTGE